MRLREGVSEGSVGFLIDNDINPDVASMLRERVRDGVVVACARDAKVSALKDGELARYCREHRLIFVTEDVHIRSRPEEVKAFMKARIGFVEVDAGTRIGDPRLDCYRKHLRALAALVDEPVPFARRLTQDRLRPISLTTKVRKSEL